MVNKLLTIPPRTALQVVEAEIADQQFCLVQPRSVGWREPRSPPMMTFGPIGCRFVRRVTRVTVLDQKDPFQSMVPSAKSPQLFDIVLGIFLCDDGQLSSDNYI